MRRILMCLVAAAVLAASPAPSLAQSNGGPNSQWNVDVKVDVDWKKVFNDLWDGARKVWRKGFTDHPTIQKNYVFPNGKHVVIVPLDSKAGGTRLTNNFRLPWPGSRSCRVFFTNIPAGANPRVAACQVKYDSKWGSDENKSAVLRHGDRVSLGGDRKYFANRSSTAFWSGSIIIVEDGISPSDVSRIAGLSIRRR